VSAEGEAAMDIAVDGEKVVEIAPRGAFDGAGKRVIDATDCLVFPGGIDPHTHYGMFAENIGGECEGPEYSYAAALGGTTTVVDFAFQDPPNTVHQAVEEKKALMQASAVDYGI